MLKRFGGVGSHDRTVRDGAEASALKENREPTEPGDTPETITLTLAEATDHQLRSALAESRDNAQRADQQRVFLHTWWKRAAALEAEIKRRRSA